MQHRNESDDLERRYDELYDQYGVPLEDKHRDEYLAVSPGGQTIVGPTMLDVAQEAKARFGPGSFLFKIGERAVGRWR
jgi:hypothetical protein